MKLLVSDYDGTLDRCDAGVLAEDIEAIKKWRDAGNLFAIATGRFLGDIQDIARKIGVDYLICCGGGDIFGKTFYPIKRFSASRQAVEELFDYLNKYHFPFAAVRSQSEEYCIGLADDGLLHLPDEVAGFEGFTFDSLGLPSIPLAKEMNELFAGRISVTSNGGGVDLTPYGVDKASAIDYLIKRIPVDASDVITVGDSNNDESMIMAYNGVTVTTGNDYIKSIARAVYNNFVEICADNM